jgi:KDO2-lipid IV(A) lauroyltransferase
VGHFLEYLFVRALHAGFRVLPPAIGRPAGALLGRLVGFVASGRTRLAQENLRRAFPDASPAQVGRWARDCWENLGQAVWEFTRLPRLSKEEYFREVDVQGAGILASAVAGGKGVILFTAHYGNWESTTNFFVHAGCRLAVIARRMKNPWVNDFVNGIRARRGANMLMHRNAVRESLRWLKSGGVVGLLIDQRITDGGLQVPFFGRPAHTTGLGAILALRRGSPVLPVHSWREGGRLHVRVDPPLDVSGLEPDSAGVQELTERMTRCVEAWTRERPGHWLWIHDRWKP